MVCLVYLSIQVFFFSFHLCSALQRSFGNFVCFKKRFSVQKQASVKNTAFSFGISYGWCNLMGWKRNALFYLRRIDRFWLSEIAIGPDGLVDIHNTPLFPLFQWKYSNIAFKSTFFRQILLIVHRLILNFIIDRRLRGKNLMAIDLISVPSKIHFLVNIVKLPCKCSNTHVPYKLCGQIIIIMDAHCMCEQGRE